ncbi:MAG: hypothetical protein HZA66_03425 [Rhodopseudomonas palustris]|uniref:Polysaccharide biosynthesis protein n=1 Tax=Rhodopseudomonas palustris TaxID=1076 RepID=A0A933RTT1_RHOPL|nr:hypothetical protein [Rhodopseudomonas palustris]
MSNVGAQVVAFGMSLALARLVSVSTFGVYGIFLAISSVGSALLLSRLDIAVALSKDRSELVHATLGGLSFIVIAGGVLTPLAIASLVWWSSVPISTSYAVSIGVTICFTSVYQVLLMVAANTKQTIVYGVGRLLNIFVISALQLVSVATGSSIELSTAHAVGQAASTVCLSLAILPSLIAVGKVRKNDVVFAEIWRRLSKYIMFGGVAAGVNILAQREVLVLLVGAVYGPAAAGLVTFSLRTVNGALGMLSVAVLHYLTPQIGAAVAPGGVRALFIKYAPLLMAIVISAVLPLITFGSELYEAIFGAQWSAVGGYVRALAPIFICQFVISPFSVALLARDEHLFVIFWDISRIAVACIMAWIAIVSDLAVLPFLLCVAGIYGLFYFWILLRAIGGGRPKVG